MSHWVPNSIIYNEVPISLKLNFIINYQNFTIKVQTNRHPYLCLFLRLSTHVIPIHLLTNRLTPPPDAVNQYYSCSPFFPSLPLPPSSSSYLSLTSSLYYSLTTLHPPPFLHLFPSLEHHPPFLTHLSSTSSMFLPPTRWR